ncbi:MAG: hypothetical protein JWQ17_117 [Tardiphaga sp.]|nr:hypothetical protein [Tardiphaga sp.]
MPDLSFIRAEIERMRVQIRRQQKDILALQRSGIPTRSAEELLAKMRNTVDALCVQRDRLLGKARLRKGMKSECLMSQQAIADIRHKS